ncbi:MAG TPA: CHAT domain-containing protein, partial [Nitrososphaera sp.]|nr:CHAT domain-containing protein [Nitrososphaera sp.]
KMKTAYALFTQSKFSEALAIYSNVWREYERIGDFPDLAFAEYRLAHCYLFLPDLEKAEITLKRLSAVCGAHHYRWLLAQCYYGLAHANVNKGKYSKALDYSAQALTAFQRASDLNGILKSLTQLADVNQVLNRIDKSLGYLSRGLTLANETPIEPMQRWAVLNETAFSMTSKELPRAALVYWKEALDIALKMGRPLIISRSYGYVGLAYAAVKLYAEGVQAAARAVETGEGMSSSPGGLEIIANASQQLGDIQRESGECAKAIQAYERSIDSYRKLKFDYYSYAAHKGKLLCFIAESDDRAAREELPKVLSLSEEYRSKITLESQRVSFFATHQSIYDLAIYYEYAHNDPVKALEYSEISRARALLDEIREGTKVSEQKDGRDLNLPAVTQSMSLSEIQQSMPAESQILEYAVLDDRLILWVVTKSAMRHQEVSIGAEQLTEKIRAYLASVNSRSIDNSPNQSKAAFDLYRILIAPVEPFLDKSKYLCIVADKILNYVPYAALVSPANGSYLVEDYEI